MCEVHKAVCSHTTSQPTTEAIKQHSCSNTTNTSVGTHMYTNIKPLSKEMMKKQPLSKETTKTEQFTKEIGPQQLLNKDWNTIEKGKPSRNIPGIYMIGIKQQDFYVLALYLGRSNHIRRRLNQHMQPSQKCKQKIDNFIQNQAKESIIVKWIEEPSHQYVEGQYLNYVENRLGYKLKYNMKAGDGETRSTDLPDAFLDRKGTRSPFRPSLVVRITCSVRPYKKKCMNRKRGPPIFKDLQLIRRINGIKV